MATNLGGPIRPSVNFSEALSSKLNSQFSGIPIYGECSACVARGTTNGLQLTSVCVITYLLATLARTSRLKLLQGPVVD